MTVERVQFTEDHFKELVGLLSVETTKFVKELMVQSVQNGI